METIIANPPFSATWSADSSFLNDERFMEYKKLAPASKADFAFVQDMIYSLSPDGLMAVVLPHGVLFRGGSEGVIRRILIEEKNYLDAVIGLPANIFFRTSIPTCILMFRKNRSIDDCIVFIDASKEFKKGKNKNELEQAHLDKIVTTYRNRTAVEKYSYCAALWEIKHNDFNLNIPRYVDTFIEEEKIDIGAIMDDIKKLEARRAELDKQIEKYLKELGIFKTQTI